MSLTHFKNIWKGKQTGSARGSMLIVVSSRLFKFLMRVVRGKGIRALQSSVGAGPRAGKRITRLLWRSGVTIQRPETQDGVQGGQVPGGGGP